MVTTIITYFTASARIISTVFRSPFPQYCAASIVVPCTRTVMHKFKMKVICPAKETAANASCSKNPSITASEALTIAVIKF